MRANRTSVRRWLTRLVVAALLVVGAPFALATAAEAGPDDSVIAGRLVAPDGTPASGFRICANDYTSAAVVCGDNAADGSFSLTVPAGGQYWLVFSALTDSFLVPETWMSPPDVPPAFVTTYPGSTTTIGNYALQLGGSISGRLLNPDGTPAAGAMVDLRNLLVENWQWDFGYSATTDGAGNFRFWHLPAIAAYTFVGMATADPAVAATGYLVEPGNDTPLGDVTLAGPTGTAPVTVTATGVGAPLIGVPTTVDVAVSGGSGVPTGTVAVRNATTSGTPVPLDVTGHATLTYVPGSYAPTVVYSGDATYGSATSGLATPGGAAGSPTLFNPGNDDASTTTGGPFDLTGTSLGAGTTFTLDGTPLAGTVDAAGTHVSFSLPPHVGGPAWVIATSSAGSSLPATANYARDGANPSITTADPTSNAGGVLTYTVHLAPPTGPTPTGTVTFRIDGGARHAVPVVGGTAGYTTGLGAGVHHVTASYSGDPIYLSSAVALQQGTTIAPTVAAVSPAVVTPLGGEVLTVTGTGFTSGTTVSIGSSLGENVVVDSPTVLHVTMPANSATGAGRVVVHTSGGVSTDNVVVTSQLIPTTVTLTPSVPAPLPGSSFTVTATVGAAHGVATGGLLTLLVDGSSVGDSPLVGGVATFTTSLTAGSHTLSTSYAANNTFAGSTGSRTVATGTSRPSLTRVSPATGCTAGRNYVTLTGTRLTGATRVTFGSLSSGDVRQVSDTSLLVRVPPHGASVVRVAVTTPAGTTTDVVRYTYTAPAAGYSCPTPPPPPSVRPQVTGVSPATGCTAGRTYVTVTGLALTGATRVTFGSAVSTAISVVSDTRLSVRVPPHGASTVQVAVTTPGGTSTVTGRYTYVAPPTGTSCPSVPL